MAHALGFSASSWPLFRDTDASRTPRTARDTRYPDQPANPLSYTCNGFQYSGYIANTNTIQYMNERGMSCSVPNNMPPYRATGDCVHKMITPRVVDAVREFFDCPTLNGAELENQLTSACDLQGSHWEQRIFNTELMASYTQHVMRISGVTLAVFEDSGWYVGNYSNIDGWKSSLDWGYHQGCSFASNKCLDNQGNSIGNPPHFYSTNHAITGASGNAVCTVDRLALGYTEIVTYSSSLPTQYQYFSDSKVGGHVPNVYDYCPAIQFYSNRVCRFTSSSYASSFVFGETFGPGSICLESNLRKSTYQTTGNGAGCYMTICNYPNLIVTVDNNNYTCTSAGQSLTIPSFTGSITCPDPVLVCGEPTKYAGNTSNGLPPLPSPSRSPLPSQSPTPTTTPSVSIYTYPFTFPGLNMSYVLGLGLNNIPTGSNFLTNFINDLATATGTSTTLLYPHKVFNKRTGITANLGYNPSQNKIYVMSYQNTNTPASRDEVTITMAYRVTIAAPSANAQNPNPAFEQLSTTILQNRRDIVSNRLNSIISNSNLFATSFALTQNSYCSLVTSADLYIAHSSGTCTSASIACVASYNNNVAAATPFVGVQIGPSSAPGTSSNSASNNSLGAIIGGGAGGGILLLIIIIVTIYCCCKKKPETDGKRGGPMIINGNNASNFTSVSAGSTNSGPMIIHQQQPAMTQAQGQQQGRMNIRSQQFVVTVPQSQYPPQQVGMYPGYPQQQPPGAPLSSMPPNMMMMQQQQMQQQQQMYYQQYIRR